MERTNRRLTHRGEIGDVRAVAAGVAAGGVLMTREILRVVRGNLPTRQSTSSAQAVLSALQWNTVVPDERITVSVSNNVAVSDGRVTLTGNVHSWFERDEARHAAWAAPGVKEVDDRISITP